MFSILELRRESQEATSQRPGSWAEPVTTDVPKSTLPPFRDILPSVQVYSSPPELNDSPTDSAAPVLESYYLPFRRARDDIAKMPFTMIKPDNETIYSTTRKTVHGKTLTYTLNVKQQPERARACGAGARGEFLFPQECLTTVTDLW